MPPIVMQTEFSDLKLVNRGKVRDIYDLGEHLLIVTSDRISAFDVIMNEGIPNKGFVLTQISKFWFQQMADVIPNHIVATELADFPAVTHKYRDQLEGRSMLVKKAKPLPVECIVR
ncbi:MAG TPA: phosphoribosylaminoimidazolesuccinocarboxamide synthase, partial [Desulfuromonadales bacterium]|nr:phosphoribosylaminoimidazolesuccinocarboxamide synthase [Desulfuromonadales bacterium]